MPERIDFWGIPHTWGSPEIFVYSLMGLAAIILLVRFYLKARLWWSVGRPDKRWDKIFTRIGRLLSYAVIQIKVLRQRYPGIMHMGLAWGFFVFFLGTALATIDSHFFKFLQGNIYYLYKFILDLFTILFLVGAGMAAYRRYITKPDRLTLKSGFTYSLVMIFVIVLGGLVTESLRLAVEQPPWAIVTPAGWSAAQLWIASGADNTTLTNWHLYVWAFHLLTVALLIITIPVSTLIHILTTPLNIFFSKVDHPMGKLFPVAETSEGDAIYVSSLEQLTWKQLLDGDACTECGRCQVECPAFAAGTPLSPKEFILQIRDSLHQEAPIITSGNGKPKSLVGEVIKDEVVWACTTCGACINECPVLIEHIDAIVDIRRFLVIEGRLDDELQDALMNFGRYGNSFGKSPRERAKWTRDVETTIKDARKGPVQYLWFVGDYASFSPTLTNITKQTVEVFQNAGLDFGILYEGEQNSGNDVRRVGEEGLFEMLVEKNLKVMSKSDFKSIVTTDPHTYNTLKNEYPDANGNQPLVFHYTELLDQLIASGGLKFSKKLNQKVTYHDPCYLGRYNGVYDAPRRIIEATGCEIVEMPRNRDMSFCCGAGGGRIWMAEGEVKERPSEARIREAVQLEGVTGFIVSCPKDVTMYQDAVKTTGQEQRIVVKDLIELVHAAI